MRSQNSVGFPNNILEIKRQFIQQIHIHPNSLILIRKYEFASLNG